MKKIQNWITSISLAIITVAGAVSCGRTGGSQADPSTAKESGDTIPMTYARNISMINRDGYVEVDMRNPWDTTRTLHKYLLVERGGKEIDLPAGATVIEVPVQRSVIYSGVHASLLHELGHIQSISGVCDTRFLPDTKVMDMVRTGQITDCGSSMSPDMERIFSLSPEVVMLSPYENNRDYTKLERAGIPVLECADYMEATPLGRAEWVRFYGRLLGEGAKADSLFAQTAKAYNDLRSRAAATSSRPTVVFDRVYGGAWYVPERLSTTGRFVEDAGGKNPFDYIKKAGSAPLTPEEVLMKGGNADIWLIRHAGEKINYTSLGNEHPVYSHLRPYRERNIYATDTSRSRVFEDAAFHPQWLLADLITLLHPELGIESTHKYYLPLDSK